MVSIEEQQPGPAPHSCLAEFWERDGARLTELVAVGGANPTAYGFISYGRGIYGRVGLEQDEYIEHSALTNYVRGMVAALGGPNSPADLWLGAQLNQEVRRVMAARQAEKEVASG